MSDVIAFEIQASPPPRLDKAMARDVPEDAHLSRSRLGKLLEAGAVTVDGTVVTDPRFKVTEGAQIAVTVEAAAESHIGPEDIPLTVVYEDADLIVVNKPASMVVHPAPGTPSGTLVNALLHHCGDDLSGVGGEKRPGIVHRIDKDTSGLLVVAKSDAAHRGLAAQFAAHDLERSYLALVWGVPRRADARIGGLPSVSFEPGWTRIETSIGRSRTDRKKMAVNVREGRHAVTRFSLRDEIGPCALLECRLETGRTHQIRVHMTHAGHALVGDPTYGGKRKLAKSAVPEVVAEQVRSFPRQALHAAVLGFVHPVSGEAMRFEAPLPQDLASLLNALRSGD